MRQPWSARRLVYFAAFIGLVGWSCPTRTANAAPAPPSELAAKNAAGDDGTKMDLTWKLSPDDQADAKPRPVVMYQILRRTAEEKEFKPVGETTYGKATFTDSNCKPKQEYWYQVAAVAPDGTKSAGAETSDSAIPLVEYYDYRQTWFGILLLLVCGSVAYYIEAARGGRDLKLRKIAGMEAVTEAVGRATEMGRPCIFVTGIQDINDIQTVAGLGVLSRVAGLAAEYDARIEVPTSRSLVMTAAREVVESAYLAAGRPDAYREDDIYYVTDEQFGFVAAVAGQMTREKPAACFYMGAFFAESLFLAETGNSIGAIQVAGTAEPAQLPFFVAACDYTLIGEEFFAASAYLSGEPHQLGALKGQDIGKLMGAVLILFGSATATLQALGGSEMLGKIVAYLRSNLLGNGGFMP